MRALIVDDERLARSELRRLLAQHPSIQIIGEAANVKEAKPRIERLRPDLLLLDVQMPGGSGFDLLEQLNWTPRVIFTTAFDRYALKAFEVNALDYLLKPITPERLASALERVMPREQKPKPSDPVEQRIFLKDGDRCWFIGVEDILLLESEGNYTRVYFGTERPLIARTLQALEERLPTSTFFRVSRKHIVNLHSIQNMEETISGGLELMLQGGFRAEMSRRRAADFRTRMSL